MRTARGLPRETPAEAEQNAVPEVLLSPPVPEP